MDVIISAPQAGGKTRAAMILATGYLNAPSWNAAQPDVLTIDGPDKMGETPTALADLIQAVKAEVVIFDGAITDAGRLRHAIEGVKIYRQRAPLRNSLLAIYCEQHGTNAVVLQFPK